MFPVLGVIAIPDLAQIGDRPQIVDMPAGTWTDPPVVSTARSHPTGAESAADVEIPAADEIAQPQTTHLDLLAPGIVQQQHIGPGGLCLGKSRACRPASRFGGGPDDRSCLSRTIAQ